MRGGAIPILLWGVLNLVLAIGNVIWTGSQINAEMDAYLVISVLGTALVLFLFRPESLRRGAPDRERSPEAIPHTSLAAMAAGLAIGAMLFGVVFGKFLVFVGGGVLLLSAGRLLAEVRAQRRSLHGDEEER